MLLQQLLRSMESSDTHRSAAITYTFLSVFVRLVASQCSVINLWFSRRCYERSRGEMITMLYEKTLLRKNIGTPTQAQKVVHHDALTHGWPSKQTRGPKSQLTSIWKGLYGVSQTLFRTTDERPSEPKKPASMGKILNMMRHASRAIPFLIL